MIIDHFLKSHTSVHVFPLEPVHNLPETNLMSAFSNVVKKKSCCMP